jgi:hypothetical protein
MKYDHNRARLSGPFTAISVISDYPGSSFHMRSCMMDASVYK